MIDVELHPASEAEYEAAFAWYFIRNPRAADGFEAAAKRGFEFISSFPLACPLIDDRHRYYKLNRYPYGLIDLVHSDRIEVVAVSHERQQPGFWTNRSV